MKPVANKDHNPCIGDEITLKGWNNEWYQVEYRKECNRAFCKKRDWETHLQHYLLVFEGFPEVDFCINLPWIKREREVYNETC